MPMLSHDHVHRFHHSHSLHHPSQITQSSSSSYSPLQSIPTLWPSSLHRTQPFSAHSPIPQPVCQNSPNTVLPSPHTKTVTHSHHPPSPPSHDNSSPRFACFRETSIHENASQRRSYTQSSV